MRSWSFEDVGIPNLEIGNERKDVLVSAVETLLAKHEAGGVAAYSHTFQALHEEGGWPTLAELPETDARLKLAA
ncbi:MAG: hypothetical protein PHQ12_09575 [Chthoniobacteraceae bacterium]|nr:hypothetical protein [Chthoniobacteraceae bacterium]